MGWSGVCVCVWWMGQWQKGLFVCMPTQPSNMDKFSSLCVERESLKNKTCHIFLQELRRWGTQLVVIFFFFFFIIKVQAHFWIPGKQVTYISNHRHASSKMTIFDFIFGLAYYQGKDMVVFRFIIEYSS